MSQGFPGSFFGSDREKLVVMYVLDREQAKQLIRDRRRSGDDRFDEVWNGVYVMSPLADNEHQEISTSLSASFIQAVSGWKKARVFAGLNVSDRADKWKKNYRCPDVGVFLAGNLAEDKGTYWFGGPDFTVEVLSPGDRSRKKLDFYTKVGVRELLLVGRKPWSLELYRLINGVMTLVGKTTPDPAQTLTSEVLPISLRILPNDPRPTIEVTQTADGRQWMI
jgi:Uma2 family endonuclease